MSSRLTRSARLAARRAVGALLVALLGLADAAELLGGLLLVEEEPQSSSCGAIETIVAAIALSMRPAPIEPLAMLRARGRWSSSAAIRTLSSWLLARREHAERVAERAARAEEVHRRAGGVAELVERQRRARLGELRGCAALARLAAARLLGGLLRAFGACRRRRAASVGASAAGSAGASAAGSASAPRPRTRRVPRPRARQARRLQVRRALVRRRPRRRSVALGGRRSAGLGGRFGHRPRQVPRQRVPKVPRPGPPARPLGGVGDRRLGGGLVCRALVGVAAHLRAPWPVGSRTCAGHRSARRQATAPRLLASCCTGRTAGERRVRPIASRA